MDENLHNIDDLFKKAMNGHEEMPSENVWEQIDKNLDKKKVVFISKKYNKLKWVAAALLMFSAGMAMYTWHTKLKNQELAKQNTIDAKKKIGMSERKKNIFIDNDTDKTSLAEVEKKALLKDTASIIKQEKKMDLPEVNNTPNEQNVNNNKKIRIEASKQNAADFKNNTSASLAKSTKKQEKSQKRILEESIRIDGSNLRKNQNKELIAKEGKSLLTEKQKDTISRNFDLSIENARKQVAANIEIHKPDLKISSTNFSLQRLLQTKTNTNTKITSEKISTARATKYNIKKSLKKSLFSANFFYSPDFVSSEVDDDHHHFRDEDRNEIKNKEEIKNAFSTGLLINYYTGKKWSVQSGLTFSSQTTAIAPKQIYARQDNDGHVNYRFNCSAGYSYIPGKTGSTVALGDSIPALSSKNILQYIGVPVAVKYNITKGKFSLSPGVGIAINFLSKGKIETAIPGTNGPEKTNLNHIEGLKSIFLNGSLGVSANYNLNRNIALSFSPAARFALTSINKDAPVKTYLNALGLAAGLTLKL